MTDITGLTVRPSLALAGARQAVQLDGDIFFSPAMYDLLRHANQRELKQLLAAIPVLMLRGSVVRLKYARVEPSFI